MDKIISFENSVDHLLSERITLTTLGWLEAADNCPNMLHVVDPEGPPPTTADSYPAPIEGETTWEDEVFVQPSDEDSVVCLIGIRQAGRERIVAKIWNDGLVRTFDSSFSAETGGVYVQAIQLAWSIVGGGTWLNLET